MDFRSRWTFIFLICCLLRAHAQTGETELNLGVAAYKNAHFEEAIQHFRRATELDPNNVNAHLYLATSYVSQFIPGVDSDDNRRFADQAIDQYQDVLDLDSTRNQKINSAKGAAYVYFNLKKWNDAKQDYQIASDLDPDDPEPYYTVGVMDWTICYQPRMEGRTRLGLDPGENLDAKKPEQKKLCDELRVKNTPTIEEGISSLTKAIALRPNYDDAMAYLNLMYRERADVECDDPIARSEDLKTADEWVDKTLQVKKARAEQAAGPTVPNPQ